MSKARLVLTALFVDRQTPAEVAQRYGVHRSWVYKLKARYDAEGEGAFEPRSRRPKSSPTAIGPATVELILELREKLHTAGLDAGSDTIAWHLAQHHATTVSVATISRYLTKAGMVTPQPKKRPVRARRIPVGQVRRPLGACGWIGDGGAHNRRDMVKRPWAIYTTYQSAPSASDLATGRHSSFAQAPSHVATLTFRE